MLAGDSTLASSRFLEKVSANFPFAASAGVAIAWLVHLNERHATLKEKRPASLGSPRAREIVFRAFHSNLTG